MVIVESTNRTYAPFLIDEESFLRFSPIGNASQAF
jgi:hypothetical protein